MDHFSEVVVHRTFNEDGSLQYSMEMTEPIITVYFHQKNKIGKEPLKINLPIKKERNEYVVTVEKLHKYLTSRELIQEHDMLVVYKYSGRSKPITEGIELYSSLNICSLEENGERMIFSVNNSQQICRISECGKTGQSRNSFLCDEHALEEVLTVNI